MRRRESCRCAAFALLVSQVLSGETQYLGVLAFSAAAMAGLLVARQLVELRENERLFASQLAQEARFRSLVQHSSDVVLVVDPASSVSYVSPSADRVFGSDGPVRVGARLADPDTGIVSPDGLLPIVHRWTVSTGMMSRILCSSGRPVRDILI